MLDSSGKDIRGTFFREAVDKFYSYLQVGKVYRITGGRIKIANPNYNTCKSEFEITFDQNTEIHEDQDDATIATQDYSFVKIADLVNVPAGQSADVLAVVKHISDVAHIVSKKSGQEMAKCDLTLADDSGAEITLTVWRDQAETAPTDFAHQPVVAFRRARVSDYGGKSLSLGGAAAVNPLPQANALAQWWRTVGATATTTKSLSSATGGRRASLTERQGIADIKNKHLGSNSEKGDYISIQATLSFLKKDKDGGAWYPACPNAKEPCKNRYKVTQTTDNQWTCDKCGGTYPTCVRRWIFSGVVQDESSSTWVSFFNEQAETLLQGVTADQAYGRTYEADGSYNQRAYNDIFAPALYTEWILRCKVKNEIVNDEQRIKTSVAGMWPVDYLQESKELLAEIAKF